MEVKSKFGKWLVKVFKIPSCPKCGAIGSYNRGYWHAGWNNLCNQATGRNGLRCFDCGHFKWDESLEEWKETLPEWITPYESEPYQ